LIIRTPAVEIGLLASVGLTVAVVTSAVGVVGTGLAVGAGRGAGPAAAAVIRGCTGTHAVVAVAAGAVGVAGTGLAIGAGGKAGATTAGVGASAIFDTTRVLIPNSHQRPFQDAGHSSWHVNRCRGAIAQLAVIVSACGGEEHASSTDMHSQ